MALASSVPPLKRQVCLVSRWPAPTPRPESAAIETVPPLIVVAPLYVLTPDRVNVPGAVLGQRHRGRAVADDAGEGRARVQAAGRDRDRAGGGAGDAPAPATDPIVSLKPSRSKVAPEATVSALLAPIALVTPSLSVPALTVVAPVYVLRRVERHRAGAVLGQAAGRRRDGAADGDVACSTDRQGEGVAGDAGDRSASRHRC